MEVEVQNRRMNRRDEVARHGDRGQRVNECVLPIERLIVSEVEQNIQREEGMSRSRKEVSDS